MADCIIIDSKNNQYPARSAELLLSFRGNWSAHFDISGAENAPEGSCTIKWLDTDYKGYILRTGVYAASTMVLIVGGKGGLWKQVPPKMYDFNMAAQLPLSDILSICGERLSLLSTRERLFQNMKHWVRKGDEGGNQIKALADSIGTGWRVLPDGSIFFGDTIFTPHTLENYYLKNHLPEANYSWFNTFSTSLQPGHVITINSASCNVTAVKYKLDGGGTTAEVWYQDKTNPLPEDPLHAGLSKYIREVTNFVDYHAMYAGKVVLQRANGTIDVVLDNPKFPPLTSVPIRVPAPGAKINVAPGSRVIIAFDGGVPTEYSALLYDVGNGGKPVARKTDTVDIGNVVFKFTPPGALSVTYTDPMGIVQEGLAIKLKGIISSGSDVMELS